MKPKRKEFVEESFASDDSLTKKAAGFMENLGKSRLISVTDFRDGNGTRRVVVWYWE